MGLLSLKVVLVIMGWGTSIAGATLTGIFQGLLLPQVQGGLLPEVMASGPIGRALFYLGVFGIAVLGALVIEDLATSLAAFLSSYVLAGVITYMVLALPGFIGAFQYPEALVGASIIFTFTALFPVPLLVGLFGTLLGSGLGEWTSR